MRHVEKTDSCWLWTGWRNSQGYGKISRSNKGGEISAHRLSYEMHIGPIEGDLCVCHTCDTPPCVNPDHLFLGTRKENNQDRHAKGRTVMLGHPGEKNPMAKLTRVQVDELRAKHAAGGRTTRSLAAEYGVSCGLVSGIISGKRWI